MPSRKKAAPKKKAGKPALKKAVKKAARQPARKPVAASAPAPMRAIVAPAPSRPVPVIAPASTSQPRPAAAARPLNPGQVATAAQAEERRKAATRKLFARIRSLEAIVGADLRKRGSLLLSQAVDQWYAEATSATASDVSITNAARAVISQL
jgi:flagella basal body P-ring formation protein FlgA